MKAVKDGKIKFIPKQYEKLYFHWMENIRDWCVSRQIWWGHRIPVWYKDSKIKVQAESPGKGWEQDPDTLDTWFSSGQWPFSVFGGPEKTKEFDYFYPTTVMETGWDILFFWVARMIMLGIYCTGKIPFEYVYLHGLVRDKDRQKMSKSKGNVIDPLGVIDLYGADALRMALVFGTGPGKDIIISEEKIIGQRRFSNKIWNAARFVLAQTENFQFSIFNFQSISNDQFSNKLTKADKDILEALNKTIKSTTKSLDDFRFHEAAQDIYHFFWHYFCDIYIEQSKKQIDEAKTDADKNRTLSVLSYVLLTSLKLLHPFMPFVTETIYQMFPDAPIGQTSRKIGQTSGDSVKKALIIENWPTTT
jgi:valyl-tRNA synthetase